MFCQFHPAKSGLQKLMSMTIRNDKDRGGTDEVAVGKRRLGKSGIGIRLFDSRNKTLAVFRKGYRNFGAVEVMCNTQKLKTNDFSRSFQGG